MTEKDSNIVSILKEVELFSEFDDPILENFAANMSEMYISKGTTLFNKGDQENAMYIILDGSVEVHDGDYIFTTLNSKQFFGEYSLIDSAVRSASVTAVRDTQLLELKQEVFNKVTIAKPELWKNVLIPLIKRLRDYNIVEEKLTLRTIDIQKKKYEVEQEKEKISQQKRELEAINETKDRFLTIIGHDLKNPFITLIGLSDMLQKKHDELSKIEIIEYLQQINRYSKNAYSLLENLLQWSRSQTGSLKINFKRANFKTIVDSVISLYELNARQKNITIESCIDEELHGYFDADMTTTVIRNLISNALKFTNDNGKISIKAIEVGDMIQIEVTDTGIGMSEEVKEELFKLDKENIVSKSIDNTGTGLGMVLIKEFVLKNGGEIWVESELNVGTKITFTLPKAL